jgi:hypothetical protein
MTGYLWAAALHLRRRSRKRTDRLSDGAYTRMRSRDSLIGGARADGSANLSPYKATRRPPEASVKDDDTACLRVL